MAETLKYLITVDAETGATLKVEQVGEAGELTEVPISGGAPAAGLGAPAGAPQSFVVNVYIGGVPQQLPGSGAQPMVRMEAGPPPVVPAEFFGPPKPPPPKPDKPKPRGRGKGKKA